MALIGPWFMHLAIPALFHTGNLFQWEPAFGGAVFLSAYWVLTAFATVAFVHGRRAIWWLLLVLVLAATVPRLGLLVYNALLVT